jgi:two-component system sensor histidine kinase/response regulator
MNREDYKILVVDDILENIQVLCANLSEYGYKTGFATNGYDCLRLCDTGEYHLILLDIMMPGIDGFEVLEIIRKERKNCDIPIIFVTAKTDDESIVKGLRLGAQDYVTKPFNSEELRSRIDTQMQLYFSKKRLEAYNEELELKVKNRTAELEKANLELSYLEEAKSYFLTLLAHELNTPLSLILVNSNYICDNTKDNLIKDSCLTLIEAANRLKRFSDIALLITKLRAQKYRFNYVDYPISDIINNVIFDFTNKIKEKNLSISKNIIDDDLSLNFDPILIKEVFHIIFENSIKYSNKNSKITINTGIINDHFTIEFIDIGVGFSESAMKNLFKEFVSGEIMQHKEGTGLGLVAAKLIIEAHNGKISAENLHGAGAKVTVSLPIQKYDKRK